MTFGSVYKDYIMAKLGTKKNPVVIRVQNENRIPELIKILEKLDCKYFVEFNPDEPEDISAIEKLQNPPEPLKSSKIPRNAPCPCDSGKKYKKCCGW